MEISEVLNNVQQFDLHSAKNWLRMWASMMSPEPTMTNFGAPAKGLPITGVQWGWSGNVFHI